MSRSSRRARSSAAVGDARGEAVVEGAGDLGRGTAGHSIVDQGREERAEVELAAVEGHRVALRAIVHWRRRAGAVLEPDGGLPLEADLAGEAEERRGGVEETARGGRGEGAEILVDQRSRLGITAGEMEGRRGEVGEAGELGEEARRGLHRMARRGVAAGEPRVAQVGGAREARADAAGEEFSPQMAPSSP